MIDFVKQDIIPGSTVYTDGLKGFEDLKTADVRHVARTQPLRSDLRRGVPLSCRWRTAPLATCGFHAFRHGVVATTLIDRGASITTVRAQLLHSDPRITLGLYAHVVPQSQRDASKELAVTLSNNSRLWD
jgi:integrase